MSPKSKDCFPVKRQNTDTRGRELCDVGGRNGSDVAKDTKDCWEPPGLGGTRKDVITWSLVGGWFSQILDFRLLTCDLTFLLFYFMEFVVMTDLRN